LLVDDRDDMVVKAMSWALRELAKHDPKAVRADSETLDGKEESRVNWNLWPIPKTYASGW
jgi:3-methyladenine DNA glycosylase AlkD